MQFQYKAVSNDGKKVKGIIEAGDEKEAVSFLRAKDLIPTVVKRQHATGIDSFLDIFNKPRIGDVIFFTRQLSSMLNAGLNLMEALRVLKEQIQKKSMLTIINEIVVDIQAGTAFSKAIEKYPLVFTPVYVSLVRAGETSGLLDKVLERLAENLEKQAKIRSTIKGALMYPAIVIVAMFIVMGIMMVFVIPQLATLYDSLSVELPLPTRIVMAISRFTVAYWPLVIGAVLLIVVGTNRWYKTDTGKLIVDDLLLRLPVFGKLIKEGILTEFARTLGLLIGSGSVVVASLNQTADIVGNVLFRNAVLSTTNLVEKGVSVGDAMAVSPLFPPILVQMTKIGEQTGKMDDSLLRVADYFEREVEQTVKTLTTALEPFIMVVLGIGVAFLIISIITPIYSLTNAIH